MKRVVKQVAGIDVSQKELVITLGRMSDDFTIELFSYKVFRNTDSGIKSLYNFPLNCLKKGLSLFYEPI